MLNYQKQHYDQYRILLEDGTEITTSREECFAPGEKPTEDNPFKQRWYCSPDHKLAIRLPRSEKGEFFYRANAADLKSLERNAVRQSACVGQADKELCPMSCARCRFRNRCTMPERSSNGYGCPRKCEGCEVRVSRFRSMDKPIGIDDSGETVTVEYDSGMDVEADFIRQEEDREYLENVAWLIGTLEGDEKRLYECLRRGMTLEEMADVFGVVPTTVSEWKRKLMVKFTAAWLRENRGREEAAREFVASLDEGEQILCRCIRKKMSTVEIARIFGVHRKTIEYRREKLRRKFAEASFENFL